jgi:uncharacterized protein
MVTDLNTPCAAGENITKEGDTVFPCFCCGVCCTDYQPHLDLAESTTIAGHLGIDLQQFLNDYTDPRWPGTETHLLRHEDGMCLFLEQKEGKARWLCRIHAFKPEACRQWAAGPEKKECRKGLNRYWGLSLDDSGKLTGPEKNLDVFRLFLRNLT